MAVRTEPAYDLIAVLGAAVRPDGSPSAALRRRVEGAVAAYGEGAAPRLLMCGGAVGHATPEAAVMRDLALARGVATDAVEIEDRSRNTFENAFNARAIMAARGWNRVLVVTDTFHLPRALYIFRKIGVDAEGRGVSGRGGEASLKWWGSALREGPAFVKSAVLFRLRPTPPV